MSKLVIALLSGALWMATAQTPAPDTPANCRYAKGGNGNCGQARSGRGQNRAKVCNGKQQHLRQRDGSCQRTAKPPATPNP